MNPQVDDAYVLLLRSRVDRAEIKVRQALNDDPQDPQAHAVLALCFSARGDHESGLREAREALALDPEDLFCHVALVRVLFKQGRLEPAAAAVREMLRIDPGNPDHHVLLATVYCRLDRCGEALEAAERGLSIDPEHKRCTDLRVKMLIKLGRMAEARAITDAIRARDAADPVKQTGRGWTLLHRGDHIKALECFNEALRLKPDHEPARQGLRSALEARHRVYRYLCACIFWPFLLGPLAHLVLAVVAYALIIPLSYPITDIPGLDRYVGPVTVACCFFVFWGPAAVPLADLFLGLSRHGRMALTRDEIIGSRVVGVCVAVAMLVLIAYLVTGEIVTRLCFVVTSLMIVPIAVTFRYRPGSERRIMVAYATTLAAVGVVTMMLVTTDVNILFPGTVQPAGENGIRSGVFALYVLGVSLSGAVVDTLKVRRLPDGRRSAAPERFSRS